MFKSERIWRILANFWTIFLMIFFVINFFSLNKFDYLTPTFSVIYTAVLSLYVGTKEFERWCDRYENGRHPGELFIIWWTALMAFCIPRSSSPEKNIQFPQKPLRFT